MALEKQGSRCVSVLARAVSSHHEALEFPFHLNIDAKTSDQKG